VYIALGQVKAHVLQTYRWNLAKSAVSESCQQKTNSGHMPINKIWRLSPQRERQQMQLVGHYSDYSTCI